MASSRLLPQAPCAHVIEITGPRIPQVKHQEVQVARRLPPGSSTKVVGLKETTGIALKKSKTPCVPLAKRQVARP
ncbi:hypothetical protein CEP54_000091 [Fusarium duplospermum]|uniref:Uncharacterized protein n=1 Tax=Fusarium duplospermum TaxID=1325734 RepID=A0A428R889_9HYPO|nr:hypothetical protein CEP54_000091 [Fusarium duplospermum]